jgi:hypothetical protein
MPQKPSPVLGQRNDGSMAIWKVENASLGSPSVFQLPQNTSVVGCGRFGSEGYADVILRGPDGALSFWRFDGLTKLSEQQISAPLPLSWSVEQIADFTGDGLSDLLIRNTDGRLALWEMNGANLNAGTNIGALGPGWEVAAAADFEGDGKAGLLARNGAGELSLWAIRDRRLVKTADVGSTGVGSTVEGAADFTGDGRADILWRDSSGAMMLWRVNGGSVSQSFIQALPREWSVAQVADLNGDGRADILLRHQDSSLAVWQVRDGVLVSGIRVGVVGTEWDLGDGGLSEPALEPESDLDVSLVLEQGSRQAVRASSYGIEIYDREIVAPNTLELSVEAVGDFDGDGMPEVLQREQDGTLHLWTPDHSGSGVDRIVSRSVPAGWQVLGAADFSGDSKADILLRHTDGSVGLWHMDGNIMVGGVRIGTVTADATAQAIADFGGDGKPDILWRDAAGNLTMWRMGDSVRSSIDAVSALPNTWQVLTAGDFNGDSKADIVLQETDGQVALWCMNGATLVAGAVIGQAPEWTFLTAADVNGDGQNDLVWKRTDGAESAWLINGGMVSQKVALAPRPRDFGTVEADDVAAPGVAERIVALADWNGDGTQDILWQDSLDRVFLSEVSGDDILNTRQLGFMDSQSRASIGDYDADGSNEILWLRPATLGLRYDATLWEIRDGRLTNVSPLFNNAASIIGTADFNGDGVEDVFWLNEAGDIWATSWRLDTPADAHGSRLVPLESFFVAHLTDGENVTEIADMTGDGKLDLLVTNAQGAQSVWNFDGTSLSAKWAYGQPEATTQTASNLTVQESNWLKGSVQSEYETGVRYLVAQQAQNGTLALDSRTGVFVYTSHTGYVGTDLFRIQATDGLTSHVWTLNITVAPQQAPNDDAPSPSENTAQIMVGQGEVLTVTNSGHAQATFGLNVNGAFSATSEEVLERVREMPGDAPDYVKAWEYVTQQSYHWPGFSNWYWSQNLPLYMNSLGYGACGNHAQALTGLWQLMGYAVRYWQLSGHVVSEVFVDGSWHMLDADLKGYFTNDEGRILGVEELRANPDYIINPRTPLHPDVSKDFPATYYNDHTLYTGDVFYVSDVVSYLPLDSFYDFRFQLPSGASMALGVPTPYTIPSESAPYSTVEGQSLFVRVEPGTEGRVYAPFVLYEIYGEGEVRIGDKLFTVGSQELKQLLAARMNPDAFVNPIEIVSAGAAGLTFAYLVNNAIDLRGLLDVVTSGDTIDLSTTSAANFLAFGRDFSGDLRNDWIAQDASGGLHVLGFVEGQLVHHGSLGASDTLLKTVMDLDRDGRPDLLMADGEGAVVGWLYKGMVQPTIMGPGSTFAPAVIQVGILGQGENLVGAGNFLDDETLELVTQAEDGSVDFWLLQDGQKQSQTRAIDSQSDPGISGWVVRAVADHDGDGQADLLLQQSGASADEREIAVSYWRDGEFSALEIVAPALTGDLMGVADIDGDGAPDLLLRNPEGALVATLAAGSQTMLVAPATVPSILRLIT